MTALDDIAGGQWSIGAAGDRTAPAGLNRYVFFVMNNPVEGHEKDFDKFYNLHLGDMGLVEGWVGSQRFNLASAARANPDTAAFPFSHMAMYDLHSTDSRTPIAEGVRAFKGGRTRIYSHLRAGHEHITIIYRTLTPRIPRPDGKGNTVPDVHDYATPRENRYLLTEFLAPAEGTSDEAMIAALKDRTPQVLSIPGFNSAQITRYEPTFGVEGFRDMPQVLPLYLTLWEIELPTGKQALEALQAAEKSGAVPPLPIDRGQSQSLFWDPIFPYVTRDMFAR